jgi:hypothetical protein
MFREIILAFFGAGGSTSAESEYCKWCKSAGLDKDCKSCNKKIERKNPAGSSKRVIPPK